MMPAGTPEERWWIVRAGEYVLGTLRGRDLELFEQILLHDTAMQEEVARWEERLAPLHETTLLRTPGEHVWPVIVTRIRQVQPANEQLVEQPPARTGSADRFSPPGITPVPGARMQAPFRLLWPGIAAVATAASLLLGTVVQQQASQFDQERFQLDGVSVVETDADGDVRFVIETDYENRKVRVVAVAPPSIEAGQNLQLWQALPPGQEGVRPVALLPIEPGEARSYDVSSLIENSELFGVSIEPVGAPTDAGPTGPVIAHGRFIKAELRADDSPQTPLQSPTNDTPAGAGQAGEEPAGDDQSGQ